MGSRAHRSAPIRNPSTALLKCPSLGWKEEYNRGVQPTARENPVAFRKRRKACNAGKVEKIPNAHSMTRHSFSTRDRPTGMPCASRNSSR